MGILVNGSFETPEGYELSSVYCRLSYITCALPSTLSIAIAIYVSREKRIQNCKTVIISSIPTTITTSGNLGDAAYYYSILRTELESKGFTVTDVFEETQ